MTWLDCAIDVSENNGTINWQHVDPVITLVFAKATQGSAHIDRQFAANLAGCLATQRMIVSYHFLDPSPFDRQVHNFLAATKARRGDPAALDWEGRLQHTLLAQNVERFGVALRAVTGRDPVGYWGSLGSTPEPPTIAMQRWPRWIPRYWMLAASYNYRLAPHAPPGALFWQYTDRGVVSGIAGHVDRSVCAGTADALRAWYQS